jgi:uncharacterized protein
MKKTVVIGASDNPERYAYKCTMALQRHKFPVVPVGLRSGEINGIKILKDYPPIPDVDTVTLYVGPIHQKSWYDYIVSLKPKRVIFNPGTENDELVNLLEKNNVECIEACTLVMLAIGDY